MNILTLLLVSLGVLGPCGALFLCGKSEASSRRVHSLLILSSLLGIIGSVSGLMGFFANPLSRLTLTISAFPLQPFVLTAWSAFFLTLLHIGTLLASFFAIGYLPRYTKVYSFRQLNIATLVFLVGMQTTLLAGSVLGFLLSWELMSLAAYFLVIADREGESLRAGFLYLIMTHIGVACLFGGFFLLAQGDLTVSFVVLAERLRALPSSTFVTAFFLLFAGFGSKAGLVPLHQWLPQAHPQAPSHGSALMSGVMLKIALYGFILAAFSLLPILPAKYGLIVAGVGLASAIFGALYAAVETDLKRLFAWSSIENMGLMFMMVGFALAFRALHLPYQLLLVAAALQALNHTFFKFGLFLSAGAIISETHTRDLDALGGLAKKWVGFSKGYLILSFAAAALPPLGTFYAEWLLLQSLASSMTQTSRSLSILLIVALSGIAFVSGLAIFAYVKAFASIFLSKARSKQAEHVHALPYTLTVPVYFAAAAAIVLGFVAAPLARGLEHVLTPGALPDAQTSSFIELTLRVQEGSVWPVLVMLGGVILWALTRVVYKMVASSRPIRLTDTWDCGQSLTPRMEYTATGFSAPIRFFFRSVLLARKEMHTERIAPENPWILRRTLRWETRSIWEEVLYRPIAAFVLALSERVKQLHSGVIQAYLLLILVTLIIVLVVAL